ncbi:Vacuolar protein sorting-associated protein 9A [Cardamine amara subsp. amara]|uniref:Vacuolar protein sorting-associated protein 9A n=1 Tax=Cardamine amara subsp. amara TaxID=228776 RepID=A0ABD1A3U2_CARAN
MENTDVFLGLHDFLERMRKPSAGDFVKSIKSFIVSFSNNAPDPEKDCAMVQEFFAKMEAAFRAHPLWSGSSEEELDSAGDGLEKYVMTKLFTRVFASNTEDVIADEKLFQKMALVQQFISPENLDIQPTFQNESSWLLAQKELQKINMYKAPRDKLVCVLNCCKVINNLLLNASIASNENTPGADEFLPVLIYVTIKANPPQLHSNLLYIQRYRRESKLVGEAAYFFTNILSAESFISNIDAKSISMDEAEFEKNMESARARISGLGSQSYQTGQGTAPPPRDESTPQKIQMQNLKRENTIFTSKSSDSLSGTNEILNTTNSETPMKKVESISDLENKGAATLLKDTEASKIFQEYPYIYASAGDLRIGDVEGLLNSYKELVYKYVCLSKGLGDDSTTLAPSSSALKASSGFDATKESEDHTTSSSSDVQMEKETDRSVDDLIRALQGEGDKLSDVKQEAILVHGKDEERDPKTLGESDAKDIDFMKQSSEREKVTILAPDLQKIKMLVPNIQLRKLLTDQNDPSRC